MVIGHTPNRGVPPHDDAAGHTDQTTHIRVRTRVWVWWLAGGVLTVMGVGALLTGMLLTSTVTTRASSPAVVKDLTGHRVRPDGPTESPEQLNVRPLGVRFSVPAVGLNVPVSTINAVNGQLTPPGFTDAYVVGNMGVTPEKPTQGTVFVIMHSVRGGGTGPGNYLINVSSGTATVAPGDTVTLGNDTYTVTGAKTELKTTVPTDAALWANTPGRLVIITCMQLPTHAESTHNLIITATLTTT